MHSRYLKYRRIGPRLRAAVPNSHTFWPRRHCRFPKPGGERTFIFYLSRLEPIGLSTKPFAGDCNVPPSRNEIARLVLDGATEQREQSTKAVQRRANGACVPDSLLNSVRRLVFFGSMQTLRETRLGSGNNDAVESYISDSLYARQIP